MKTLMTFITYDKLHECLGMRASAYREKIEDGRHIPTPMHGTLEHMDGMYVLMNERTYTKLEEGEGVFLV